MYISEIKIHGFKSFAKKEIIKLGPGITAVLVRMVVVKLTL